MHLFKTIGYISETGTQATLYIFGTPTPLIQCPCTMRSNLHVVAIASLAFLLTVSAFKDTEPVDKKDDLVPAVVQGKLKYF